MGEALTTGKPSGNTSRSSTVLVTGATGFIGSHLCQKLIREGYTVRVLVRDVSRGGDLRREGAQITLGDLRDASSLASAVEGVGTVYHLAATFQDPRIPAREYSEVNTRGTEHLLDASARAGVKRFVHCSTVGVLGGIGELAKENAPYAPLAGDFYQQSKIESEKAARRYFIDGRLETVIFRTLGVYGPRDLRFLKLLKAIESGWFVMVGSGTGLFQMTYIDDLINGIVRCGTKEQAAGRVYHLVGGEALTLNEHVRAIAEALGVPCPRLRVPFAPVYGMAVLCEMISRPLPIRPPLYRRRVNFFRWSRSFDISKAARELGFQPRVDLRTGIRLTAEWYRKNGLL